MPLLKDGRCVDDVWSFAADGEPLSPSGAVCVTLARFLADEQLAGRNDPVGVRLQPADDPGLLADHLHRIRLIEVSFPKYTDGRGYSQAELLRRRHGYAGELRAVGNVLHDQLGYMVRAGFDALKLDAAALGERDPETIYRSAVGEFTEAYQSAADARQTVFEKRHSRTRQAST